MGNPLLLRLWYALLGGPDHLAAGKPKEGRSSDERRPPDKSRFHFAPGFNLRDRLFSRHVLRRVTFPGFEIGPGTDSGGARWARVNVQRAAWSPCPAAFADGAAICQLATDN